MSDDDNEPSRPVSPGERRAAARTAVGLAGQLSVGGTAIECEIVDLSVSGAGLQLQATLPQRKPLLLAIPDYGEFPGEIVWQLNGRAGFAFAWPLPQMEDILAARTRG